MLPTQPLASPFPLRQFQLLGPTTRYSIEHPYTGLDDGRDYLRYLSLWQLGATRALQRTGLLVSLVITSLLMLMVVISARNVRRALADMGRFRPP